ncbi:MAG: Wzz/FepE/Etk N-terminal domain-containing protein [Ignavibacteriaceae bacterium]
MAEDNKVDLLDYLVILVKWKKLLLVVCIISLIVSYLAIYFFVDKKYESTSLLLPSNVENSGSILSGLSSLKSLPFDIGGLTTNSDVDLYNSIIYSRSLLDQVIKKFDLVKIYKVDTTDIDYFEQVLKRLRNDVNADINDDGVTYIITTAAPSPQLSADIDNFIVKLLNDRVIELKIKKSKENKQFLEARVNEIKDSLKYSENQLKLFQEKTGMFEAENQTKAILEQLAEFQAQLAEKQTQYSVYKEIYGENSPQALNAKIIAGKFEAKLKNIESGRDSSVSLLSLNKLPQNALNYFRLFRDVQIYTNILEFELPLYEQARIQEKKDIPILQVIDYAIPPAKKSFPPRVLFASLITIVILLFVFIYILLLENEKLANSEKFKFIKTNLFKWKTE